MNESILWLFRHNRFKPDNFDLSSKSEGTFCHRIANYRITWPKSSKQNLQQKEFGTYDLCQTL